MIAAAVAGAAWAALAGVLRVRWGAPEIITTVILISVAELFVSYLVLGPLAGKTGEGAAQSSDPIPRSLWLAPLAARTQASVGFFIAVGAAGLIALFVYRSRTGYELTMYGHNPRFTFYGGVRNVRVFMRAMVISGGLSGLAGGIEVLGSLHRLPSSFGSGLGFQGIAVSLVASNNPVGVVVSALFFGGLRSGGTNLQIRTGTPPEVIDIISAVVILGATARIGQILIRSRRPARLSEDV